MCAYAVSYPARLQLDAEDPRTEHGDTRKQDDSLAAAHGDNCAFLGEVRADEGT